MKYDVFISHKGEDEKLAKELYAFLKNNNLTAFLADRSLCESDYKKQIDNALENSKNLIVITTKASYLTSRWVKYEWDTFLKEILSDDFEEIRCKQLFTIIDDKIRRKDLPLSLRNLQYFYLSDYQDKLLSFLITGIVRSPKERKQKILNGLSNLKNKLLKISSVFVIIVLIFSIFFSVGFGYTHFSERRYDQLYELASKNIKLQENGRFAYFLLETEDVFYDFKDSTIVFIPKTMKTINIYESKRNEVIRAVTFFGIGSLITTLFKIRIRGNGKQMVLLYVGGAVAIISGYGVGHNVSLKCYPAIESDRMKEFLSEKENWEMIVEKKE